MNNINNEDFVNFVDEVLEEMEVDNIIEKIEEIGGESDESDEDHVLSDSDRISDYSDDLTEISRKVVTNSQLNALNRGTKHCAIYLYYSTGGVLAMCASCIIDLVGVELGEMYPTRRHVIDTHDAIDGRYCSNCKNPLFFIFPCNMCPMCTQ